MQTSPTNYLTFLAPAVLFLAACASLSGEQSTSAPDPAAVKAITQKVADWQIATFDAHGQYRAMPIKPRSWHHQKNYPDLEWQMGALYAGMDAFRKIADSPAEYTDWLQMIGSRNQWKLFDNDNPSFLQ